MVKLPLLEYYIIVYYLTDLKVRCKKCFLRIREVPYLPLRGDGILAKQKNSKIKEAVRNLYI